MRWEDQSLSDLINQNTASAWEVEQGRGRGAGGDTTTHKGPIEGHTRSCRPAQVKVMEGTRSSRVLKAEAGTPARNRRKGHFVQLT